ncbi:MAG: DNA methyltransferase [Bacteroidota bacterium]|nr:DNA methyltransferase [Bacteroidota bacterium]MXW15233.1 site-specific DNA-methyltransferase [Rhodothermaceae bacterium]MDE2644748.1 DNA methyltransferase [Bacteroidota bacterium]MXW31915.1 site-specific DNA-methyltransferase [Rhodothermaceae bacterium]MYC03038.1 site-specific DNA-methyltransferase [Rhodothermaceae bacterium]
MSQKYEKLKTLLKELFQLDQPDLDFGLYRIMHAKSIEITQFLDNDLLPQVKAAFEIHKSYDKGHLEKHLSELIKGVERAGMNPDDSPRIKDIRILLETAVDLDILESDVYDHLYRFFKRYYSDGDFLAKRVYKSGVYAIPYGGEEIAFHWANKDQYYIKTCDYLRDYAFRLKPEDEVNPMRVHFRLVNGAEGEHANVKAANGKERVFILAESGESGHDFITEESHDAQNPELVINFDYRPPTPGDWAVVKRIAMKKPPTQKDLIDIAVKRILGVTEANLSSWITELDKPHVMASGEQANYCRLEAHLRRYTARNTFDFFIHKDLDTFLRRELDFYIKNEVLHLGDIENESILRIERYISHFKVIRMIADKIIDFLVQIEEFQKKLWLKKKFVIETHYCITVGCIPEEFYPEIAANEAQREEWIKLYSIDQINGDLITPGFSKQLSPEFLSAYPTLVVDTRFFDGDFTERMLESIGNIDDQTDGILFHSENFQALSTLENRFRAGVNCVYIDPPYNTASSEIVYKNSYKHSSWLTLMENRLSSSLGLMSSDAVLVVAIDEVEQEVLGHLLSRLYPSHQKSCITLVHNATGQQGDNFSYTHEFAYFVFPKNGKFIGLETRSTPDTRPLRDVSKGSHLRTDAANCFYPIYIREGKIVGFGNVCDDNYHPEGRNIEKNGIISVYPIDASGKERKWVFARQTVERINAELLPKFDPKTGLWDIIRAKRKFNYKTVWSAPKYSANSHGTVLLRKLLPDNSFTFPKSVFTVRDCVDAALGNKTEGYILDYFAGSGTTGHAVINLNRADDGQRKFILVEMGDYFNTVLLPRLKKVTFTPEWKDGKPIRLATLDEASRSPRIVKIFRLESYEDTLNNLAPHRSEIQQSVLDSPEGQGEDGFREQYILQYMLDVETRGSQSLLNAQAFTDPTAYKLRVKQPGSDESREVNIDLIETFNWLIGLKIGQISAPQSFIASFERDTEKRLLLQGSLDLDANGPYWFRTMSGITPDGRRAIVIWRKLTDDPEKENLVLDKWFTTRYLDTASEFDVVWVNGGNNLENIKPLGDLWKVRLIDEDFHRLMFDT